MTKPEPINCSPVSCPEEYRGEFQVWGKYLGAYKVTLADLSSQYNGTSYSYIPGHWHESKGGLWFGPNLSSVYGYFHGSGRLLRLLVRPEDFLRDRSHARKVFVQASTPPLLVWPTKTVSWPVFFDPEGAAPLDGPIVEQRPIVAQISAKERAEDDGKLYMLQPRQEIGVGTAKG